MSKSFDSPAIKFFDSIMLKGVDSIKNIIVDIKDENRAMEHTSMILSQTPTLLIDGEYFEEINPSEKDEMVKLGSKGLLIPISPGNLLKVFESKN